MAQGTVTIYNTEKGFGFITSDDGDEKVFVHFSDITGSGYKSLSVGDRVEFDRKQGAKGIQAANVRIL